MKSTLIQNRLLWITLVIIPAIIFISCEEDFNPKGEIKSGYVLNCIIRLGQDPDNIDSSGYLPGADAYLSRTFDIDGFIPSRADSSAYIKGADINIKYLNKYISLKDTSLFRRSRFDSTLTDTVFRYKYYTSPGFSAAEGSKVELVARTPDGIFLSSQILIPHRANPMIDPPFESGITSKISQAKWRNSVEFNWDYTYYSDCLYFPMLEIQAVLFSTNKKIKIEVPCRYIVQGGKHIPVYPGAIRDYKVQYEYPALDSAMKNLSKGIKDKSDICITGCKFSVITYERSLASYYTSTHGYMDKYSVRLDQNVYSNISGGYGIFGSSVYAFKMYRMEKNYVWSFGYEN